MESMSGGTYTPSGSQQTISCTNKKMTSDIVLGAIPNNYMKVELFYDLANPIICSDWLDINSNVPDKADQTVYKGFDVDNNICPVVDDIAYLWVILTKDTKTGKYVNYLTSGIIYSELLKPDIQRLRLPLTTGYFGGLRFFYGITTTYSGVLIDWEATPYWNISVSIDAQSTPNLSSTYTQAVALLGKLYK